MIPVLSFRQDIATDPIIQLPHSFQRSQLIPELILRYFRRLDPSPFWFGGGGGEDLRVRLGRHTFHGVEFQG